MGFGEAIAVMKNLFKIVEPADELEACLNEQQAMGVKLSPRLRNALAMYALIKKDAPDPDTDELLSFRDSCWYYLDILDELEANPSLVPPELNEAFTNYKTYLKAAQAAGEKGFDRQRAKWEKKHRRAYEPKPRRNLIGEPLE